MQYVKVDTDREQAQLKAEERRLAVMMIPKKNKRLFDQIQKKKRIERHEVKKLENKREKIIQAKAAFKAKAISKPNLQ